MGELADARDLKCQSGGKRLPSKKCYPILNSVVLIYSGFVPFGMVLYLKWRLFGDLVRPGIPCQPLHNHSARHRVVLFIRRYFKACEGSKAVVYKRAEMSIMDRHSDEKLNDLLPVWSKGPSTHRHICGNPGHTVSSPVVISGPDGSSLSCTECLPFCLKNILENYTISRTSLRRETGGNSAI